MRSRFVRENFSERLGRMVTAALALLCVCAPLSFAQTQFLDFNTPGQYTNAFFPFNDVNGTNAGGYAFAESPSSGVGASGGVSVFLAATANDTTATYTGNSWDFSSNGAAIMLSTLIKANGQISANKVQLGILNVSTNGFYSSSGVAFESFRVIPQNATTWSLREQSRTTNVTTEATLGDVTVVPGRWYKFSISLTNISGASGNCSAACALHDYGVDGLTPGTNIISFLTLRVNTGQDVARDNTVWVGLRAIQSAGIDAWDNFVVFTPTAKPIITLPLSNAIVAAGATASFRVLADGPGTLAYSWYTNGTLVGGASGSSYITPPVNNSYSNIIVVVSNSNGSTTNGATISVVAPGLATVTNLPATGLLANAATLNGRVLSTGGDPPAITVFYGPVNGGTNPANWANSVSLGPQSGTFAHTASGLTPNTSYFFTARAVNIAGTSWASPSLSFVTPASSAPGVAVLTCHNDNARLGVNASETQLTVANVTTNSFGKLFSRGVDDQIYAQPLVMTNVNIPGTGPRNVVYVATVNDSVYAFDADEPYATAPYWQRSFLGPGITAPRNTDMTGACGGNYNDFTGAMGIVGTPVIDPVAGTIFLVARTKEVSGVTTNFVQRLHAMDLATGAERPSSPVVITATYPGSGSGSVGGVMTFDPQKQNQRPALTLVNGVVYIAWSSHCDWGPYHGWLIGYDAQTLARVAVYNSTPNGGLGGFWQAGGGPSVDGIGNLYLITGNGTFNAANNDFGETFLKLGTGGGLTRLDYFTPYDYANLNSLDADLGAGAAVVLPDSAGSAAHPHLLVGAGKGPKIYLIDRDNMGQFNASGDSQIVQVLTNAFPQGYGSGSYSTPAFFNNTLYYFGKGDRLKAFRMSGGLLSTNPPAQGSATTAGFGATPSISANGTNNGIVWVIVADAYGPSATCILRAYNATNVAQELYNSNQLPGRDNAGGSVKFATPTVANGKVYVGARNVLTVFGNGVFLATPTIAPNGGTFTNSIVVTLAVGTSGATIRYTLDGSEPGTNATVYAGPFVVTNSVAVKARAFKAGAVDSGIAVATFINSSAIGTGTGLIGNYWSNQLKTFNGAATLSRLDPSINFNWGSGSPHPSISPDSFTARWTGTVQPQFTEAYTFYTSTDDGARLWLNDQLLIDKWIDQGPTEWPGTGPVLSAQQKYNIRMEYYENGGGAVAQLLWSSPTVTKTIIPQSQLYPSSNQPPTVVVISPTNASSYRAVAAVTLSANASGPEDRINRVDFYLNSNLVGSLTNSSGSSSNSFNMTATGIAAGNYSVTARAFDAAGYSSTSAPVNITVLSGSGLPYGLTVRAPAAPFLNMPPTINGSIPQKLSETGVFSDTPNMAPISALVPYDVNVPLWSDGALKTRWLVVPNNGPPYTPDEQISFASTGEWGFPAGTLFVKHFYLNTDESNPSVTRRLETRLLVRDTSNAVYGVTYKWRPDYSDADLVTNSLTENIVVTNSSGLKTQAWYYPSPADCLVCHTPYSGSVLGVKTRQLNGLFLYPSSVQDNQLRTLNRVGLFYPAFNESNIVAYARLAALTNVSASLEDRSRSYLDANCAQCHRPGGVSHAGFDARYDTPLAAQNIVGAAAVTDLGIDNARVVAPKDIWRSLLHLRGNSIDPSIKMPPLARNLVDVQAMSVIADWINSLPGTPALEPPTVLPPGGIFFDEVGVVFSHPDPAVVLRYTFDNSMPGTNSPAYAGPFTLTNSVMLRAKAFKAGFVDSAPVNALFSIRPPVFFTPAAELTAYGFELELSGIAGRTYVFQATTDFMNWIPVGTNIAPSNVFNFLDVSATNFPARFYRALERP